MEEVQSTLVRDDHANMTITCAMKDSEAASYQAHLSADSNSNRRTRRFSRENTRRASEMFRRDSLTVELVRLKSIAQYQLGMMGLPSALAGADGKAVAKQELMTFGKCTLWAEYFNNMRKCWEPLLEKTVATVLYEKVIFTSLFCPDSGLCRFFASPFSLSLIIVLPNCKFSLCYVEPA